MMHHPSGSSRLTRQILSDDYSSPYDYELGFSTDTLDGRRGPWCYAQDTNKKVSVPRLVEDEARRAQENVAAAWTTVDLCDNAATPTS